MYKLIILAGIAALLGSAVIGGVFFAFSSFVMKALARLPSPQGIAAMQSINVVVINRSFLGTFFGTALLSIGLAVLALTGSGQPGTMYFVSGAIFYVVGTFLVTIAGNVPLNDRLAAADATDPGAESLWENYLDRWTMWNHVRTLAAIIATLLFALGLMKLAGA